MYKDLLESNLDGCSIFIYALVTHEGILNTDQLRRVVEEDNELRIILGNKKEKKNNFSIGMGGEVSNSFCTLYEVAYFFQALFLSAVGTAIIKKIGLETYKRLANKDDMLKKITQDLRSVTEKELFDALQHPLIAIISSLDTDIIPLRYNKHQLWQLAPRALTMRVDNIDARFYNQERLDTTNEKKYWVQDDVRIAQTSMQSGYKLTYVKALQFYQIYKIICTDLGIDIKNIPLYFNFVPKQEIVENGNANSYLHVLLALHSQQGKNAYRKRTDMSKPWMIGVSCPNCQMASKRVISYKLLADNKTTRCVCRNHVYSYRNEHGDVARIKGCGHVWQFSLPQTPEAVWQFIKNNDITLHFATRWLICLLKDTVDSPVGYVLTDMGVIRDKNNRLQINPTEIKGYGDHRDMLTSALEMQDWLIQENIKSIEPFKKSHMIMPRPLYLFGYDHPIRLIDNQISTKEHPEVFVSDTSFMKAWKSGMSVADMFKKSVRVYPYTIYTLRSLRYGKHRHKAHTPLLQ